MVPSKSAAHYLRRRSKLIGLINTGSRSAGCRAWRMFTPTLAQSRILILHFDDLVILLNGLAKTLMPCNEA